MNHKLKQFLDTERLDVETLIAFARLGLKLFWLRQFMFISATVATTVYLASPVPIFGYLSCLVAELAEARLDWRLLADKDITPAGSKKFVVFQALIAALSSISIVNYAIVVALLGETQFLFVPLTYLLAAALYGTIFNYHVRPVLVVRTGIYVLGFLGLAGAMIITADPNQQFLAFTQFLTVVSASVFVVINALEFRRNFEEARERTREAIRREARLHREIDERRAADVALNRSENRFKTLFESVPIPIREEDLSGMTRRIDALGISDPVAFGDYLDHHPEFLEACAREIVVVNVNRASLRQHGYKDKSEMLARVVRELSPASKAIVRMTVSAIHARASGRSYETTITRADGEVRTVAATWSVVPGHEDTYARILLCSIDITDRLTSEAALRQAQKMEAVGQLTGGVAHDFNNLLTVISGNLDLLETTGDLDPDFAEPIRNAVHRGAELTQRLLAFSRKQPLSAQAIKLTDLIRGMSNLLQRSLGEEIRVEVSIPDDLWLVHADPGQVEAALLNLTLNARDAMPGGGTLKITCRNVAHGLDHDLELEAGDFVVLQVADTGTGMRPDVARRAYEPFFTTKEVGKGSGLGLSMVYGFAKQSGGAMKIESVPDEGTAISLFLPRSGADEVDHVPTPTLPHNRVGRSETVLVLEDDTDVRKYMVRLMKSLGFEVLEAADAVEARHIVRGGAQIDLLLSDIMLPGGTRGPDFAQELLSRAPSTAVVFVSGRPSELDPTGRAGMDNAVVVAKPFTRDEISRKIEAALGRR